VYYEDAKRSVDAFVKKYRGLSFTVGEMINANPYELSLSLLRYGFEVKSIYANLSADDYVYLNEIGKISPDTKVYSSLYPTMLYYDFGQERVDVTLGKDAAYYYPEAINYPWNMDTAPFGYQGLKDFFDGLDAALEG
jgi:nitrogenase molybdenum-cofactor synthesis protein NifE